MHDAQRKEYDLGLTMMKRKWNLYRIGRVECEEEEK